MATPVIMPKQGQSVETCIITQWFKIKGDKVSSGDLLFAYETDKAAFEMESPADGILLETFFDEGSEVPVLTNVAAIGKPGEDISPLFPGHSDEAETIAPGDKSEAEKSEKAAIPANIPGGDNKIRISPRAKRMAEEKGINYSALTGTGPNGRIIISDIENAASGSVGEARPSAAAEYTEKPLTSVRRMIAKAMLSSLQNSAQVTHHMSADVRRLLEARKKIKTETAAGIAKQDITLNDMVCWCVTRALEKFPEANSHFLGESIRTFSSINLGIAVDTPRGLMVPVVKDADKLDINQLSEELKSAAESCRRGNINPELIQSTAASFTISNLGSYGVEMFTPVINMPQVAILGVCTIVNRPADMGDNIFGFVPYMGLSLTYDHRAIDGGPATLFLKEIRHQIEGFEYKYPPAPLKGG